ncbi:hypothetical protein [Larkinella punicea]|uniref:Uncharacterized protein n=1 Tax=Larkinella punicea TaxID=2315727 RepID=A0A368JCZ5_9BACT|nr:hypothetical protein [Larkinella punicea]RCR65550.1 hypothetical protein DUE52_31285 [Larkinella punicea]
MDTIGLHLILPEGYNSQPAFAKDVFDDYLNPGSCNFLSEKELVRLVPLEPDEYEYFKRVGLISFIELGGRKICPRPYFEPLLFATYRHFPLVHPHLHRFLYGAKNRNPYSPKDTQIYLDLFPSCSQENVWLSRDNRQGSRLVSLMKFIDQITCEFEKAMTDEDFEDGAPEYVPHRMIDCFAMWQRGQWHLNTEADPAWHNQRYR